MSIDDDVERVFKNQEIGDILEDITADKDKIDSMIVVTVSKDADPNKCNINVRSTIGDVFKALGLLEMAKSSVVFINNPDNDEFEE